MKSILIVLCVTLLAIFVSCKGKETKSEDTKKSDLVKLEIPDSYKLLLKADGDLDNDGAEERVYVYNTDKKSDNGYERNIYICKKEKDEWMQWKLISGPVLPSGIGKSTNDPFESLVIESGLLYISHKGGTTDKWYFNHCFKLIDKEFRLVKAVVDYGRACAKWETYIYDLETGKLSYQLAPEECDDVLIEEYVISASKEYTIKADSLPQMQGFIPGQNILEIPEKVKRTVNY